MRSRVTFGERAEEIFLVANDAFGAWRLLRPKPFRCCGCSDRGIRLPIIGEMTEKKFHRAGDALFGNRSSVVFDKPVGVPRRRNDFIGREVMDVLMLPD